MLSRTPKALWALLVSLVFCGAAYAQNYNHDHYDRNRDKHEYRSSSRYSNSNNARWNREQADRVRHERDEAYRRENRTYNNGYYNGRSSAPYYGGAYNGPYNSAPYYGGYGGYPSGGYGGYPGGAYGGYPSGAYGGYAQNNDTQRAYSAGYNNGVNDRGRGKGLNLKTGNWHGINLQAYQRGYEDGYRGGGGRRW